MSYRCLVVGGLSVCLLVGCANHESDSVVEKPLLLAATSSLAAASSLATTSSLDTVVAESSQETAAIDNSFNKISEVAVHVPSESDLDFDRDSFTKHATTNSTATSHRTQSADAKISPPTKSRGRYEMVTVVEKFADGSISHRWQEKRYFEGAVVRHGSYVEFYENGKRFIEGKYVDGRRTGTWTYWHVNGKVAKSGDYLQGKTHGHWLVYGADGLLNREENYLSGRKHGVWAYFHTDGKTVLEKNVFDQDRPHGVWTKWYPPGVSLEGQPVREYETRYENGKLHGETQRWYHTGQQFKLESYRQGKPHGTFRTWRQGGSLVSEMRYENGQEK